MDRLFARLDAVLDSLSKPILWAVMLVSIALVGALDHVTGTDVSVALFYLFPVAIAAWWLGRGAGVGCSVACAAVWFLVNDLGGQKYTSVYVHFWNASIRMAFFLVVTLLLTRMHSMLRRERALSRVDYLTGAYNVRAFHEIAEAECQRASRYPQPLTVVYIDLDGFKRVNDQHGHQEGDRVLRAVAQTLRGGVRRPDTVARLGGDEFALLLPQTDPASAQVFLPRLRDELLAAMSRHNWRVTFSIGALTCPVAPAVFGDVVREADGLMYEVKKAGRDAIRYAVYHGPTRSNDAAGEIPVPAQAQESRPRLLTATPKTASRP